MKTSQSPVEMTVAEMCPSDGADGRDGLLRAIGGGRAGVERRARGVAQRALGGFVGRAVLGSCGSMAAR